MPNQVDHGAANVVPPELPAPPARRDQLKVVHDTVRLMDYLARSRAPVGVRRLASAVGISKSSCQRILSSLEEEGVVEQVSEVGNYRLGPRVVSFASGYRQSSPLVAAASPIVAELSALTGETCCLYVPVPGGRLPVVQVESLSELRWVAQVGRVYPLYLGAAGKVLLAHMDDAVIESELATAAKQTGRAAAKRLRGELTGIRRTGIARSYGENIRGVSGSAAAILGTDHQPLGSLSIYGPSSRMSETTLTRFERLLQNAVARIMDSGPE